MHELIRGNDILKMAYETAEIHEYELNCTISFAGPRINPESRFPDFLAETLKFRSTVSQVQQE